jgi:hypothetical protein
VGVSDAVCVPIVKYVNNVKINTKKTKTGLLTDWFINKKTKKTKKLLFLRLKELYKAIIAKWPLGVIPKETNSKRA